MGNHNEYSPNSDGSAHKSTGAPETVGKIATVISGRMENFWFGLA